MVYADYAYYKTDYLGVAIPEPDFPRLEKRASEEVDRLTKGRAAEYAATVDDVPIANATCAIAEALYKGEQAGSASAPGGGQRPVKSETAGRQQITYEAFSATNASGQTYLARQIQKAAQTYLYPTGLLFRGVGMC